MCENEMQITEENIKATQYAFEMKSDTQKLLKAEELILKDYKSQKEEYNKSLKEEEGKYDPNLAIFAPLGSAYKKEEQEKIKDEIAKLDDQINYSINKIAELKVKFEKEKCIYDILNKYSKQNKKNNNNHMEEIGYRILEIQEYERKRIAMDLHDTTVQNLTTLIHRSELISKLIEVDKNRAKMELISMSDVIRTIINDMRTIIYDLRPMSLSDLGLVSAFNNYIEQIKHKNTIQITFNVINDEIRTSSFINLSLYRILQEACNNCFKHAKATVLRITLSYLENDIELQISDNGVGFNYSSLKKNNFNNRFGLSIIEERVYLLQGDLNINSKKSGTDINIKIPIDKEGDEKDESN